MVAAVRCPNPACRKYMLVEDADQGKVVGCLICRQPIKVPAAAGQPAPAVAAPLPAKPLPAPLPAKPLTGPPQGEELEPIFDLDDDPPFRLE